MIIEEIRSKSLVRNGGINLFAWTRKSFNTYQGCWHDCIYCDGKAEKYNLHNDFGTKVKVKTNAPELLEAFLQKARLVPVENAREGQDQEHRVQKPDFIFFISSGACDPYQPVEKKTALTGNLLNVAYKYGVPVHILTKNKLVIKDLELIKKMNQRSYASANFSITLANEDHRKIFEPRTSSTKERFEAVRQFREAGIPCGVYMVPVLPYIGDLDENMDAIFSMAKKSGAQFVHCLGLTLRPGRVKNGFLTVLKENFPHYLGFYEQLYQNDYRSGGVDYKEFSRQKLVWPHVRGFLYAQKYGLGYSPPRYVPEGCIQSNSKVTELLLKLGFLSGIQGQYRKEKAYTGAAYFVESFDRDIFTLSKQEKLSLPLPRESYPFIYELSHHGSYHRLRELEHDVYQSLLKKQNLYA